MKKPVFFFFIALSYACSLLGQRTSYGGNNKKIVFSGGNITDYSGKGTYLLSGGTLVLQNNASYNHKNTQLQVNGSWLALSGSTDLFTVVGNDTISGDTAPAFFKVNFSNGTTNATAITNTMGIGIDSNLIFNNGITSTVRSNHHTGGLHFANNAGYMGIEGDNRHVDGYVGKAGNQAFTFPVGSGTDYRTLSITAPENNAQINVAWLAGDPGANALSFDGIKHPVTAIGEGLLAVEPSGQWDYIAPTAATNALTITVSIPDMTAFTTTGRLRLAGWNGVEWINLSGKDSIASDNVENSLLSGVLPAGGGGITALAIGSASRTPSVIIDFYGILYNCSAVLQWSTLTDINGDHQDIEYSTDGIAFTLAGSLPSHNSSSGSAYTFTVSPLKDGNNYFRIKLVNTDGQFSYSDVQVLSNYCVVAPKITLSPNPATDHINLGGLTGVNEITLLNAFGVKLQVITTSAPSIQLLLAQYPQGLYFIHVVGPYGTKSNLSFILK